MNKAPAEPVNAILTSAVIGGLGAFVAILGSDNPVAFVGGLIVAAVAGLVLQIAVIAEGVRWGTDVALTYRDQARAIADYSED